MKTRTSSRLVLNTARSELPSRLSGLDRKRMKAQAAGIASDLIARQRMDTGCKNGARVQIRAQFVGESGPYVIALARELSKVHECRWFSYCLLRYHPEAYGMLNDSIVERAGAGIDNKTVTDSYARILSGPAWLHGMVSDHLIRAWSRSEDPYWRRAALISTVALNVRSADGGTGDTPRTVAICRPLLRDKDEIVRSALILSLRALAKHDVSTAGNLEIGIRD